jgi:hypothetical protein
MIHMGSPRSLGASKSNMGVHVENHSASLKLWGVQHENLFGGLCAW